ncbi:leishmanolysin peptidase (macronuclear) [Tetrahymena thermophila SB210]|uniref:Leishmanolysin peptidase n=1 Tax=Tetrahymena thermophila (strain SB210) TaxID=312017 RepID=Q22WJ7_TETTS|nr:leishmanolysin peptidase [Tetrahymena thermophila SB210]EAR89420.2 leishmanolysin peptidase [Tetrahymena thermophila SB210]|eukprot:XP_001009665.2 leishmanolysin peptidase [Tetrahymena thermophila SB210]
MSMEDSIKLPKLSSKPSSAASHRNKSDMAGNMKNDLQSPFQLPGDDDIMMYAQIEQQRRNDQMNSTQKQKIWDKFTASTRQPLKHYKDFQAEIDDKHQPKMAYNNDQKSTLIEAQRIIKERQKKRNEGAFRRESAVEVKEQKKEMFLVSMAYGIIQKEIERLKTKAQDKDQALIQSEKQLKQDHENFTKYLEQNKQQKQDAESKADAVMKEKKHKEAEHKQLNLKLATIKSEKIRMEEQLQTYKEHKEFLDKITPKEWNEAKEKKRQELIEKVKKEWINNKLNESLERDNKFGNKKNPKGGKTVLTEKDKASLEEQFYSKLEKGEIEKIEQFEDNYSMYFTNPSQLITIFDNLEQKNLFLIQLKQEDQQDVEEVNLELKLERDDYYQKSKILREQKALLQKQIDEQINQIKSLQHKSDDNKISINNDHPELRRKIMELYQEFGNEINLHDVDSKQTLDVLAQVEIFLERQLDKIASIQDKYLVESKRKQAEKLRKNAQKESKKIEKQIEQEKKNEKNYLKMTQPSKKKEGRIDMKRTTVQVKQKKKPDTEKKTDEEEDMKYLRESFFLGVPNKK